MSQFKIARWPFAPFWVYALDMVEGETYDIPVHDDVTPIDEETSATFVFGGAGMVHGPDYSLPVSPGYNFAFGVRGMGFNQIEAVTPLRYMCISRRITNEDTSMYKIETHAAVDPFDISDANGIAMCVISGQAECGGVQLLAGSRIDLTGLVQTVTPVAADGDARFQYFFIKVTA